MQAGSVPGSGSLDRDRRAAAGGARLVEPGPADATLAYSGVPLALQEKNHINKIARKDRFGCPSGCNAPPTGNSARPGLLAEPGPGWHKFEDLVSTLTRILLYQCDPAYAQESFERVRCDRDSDNSETLASESPNIRVDRSSWSAPVGPATLSREHISKSRYIYLQFLFTSSHKYSQTT